MAFPSHNNSGIERFINYSSFAISAFLYAIFKLKRPDIIYAYHPPLTVGICALFLKIFFRARVFYDVQDIWPDSINATGFIKNKFLIKNISIVCNIVYKFVDRIIVISPGFKNLLIKRC